MKDLNYYGNYCIDCLENIGIYPNRIEEFNVNTRAKSRWGQAQKRNGKYKINISIELLADECPERALLETMYHELLHCVDGCMNHGKKWQELADLVNDCYSMNITRCSSTEDKVGKEYAKVIKANKENEKNTYTIRCVDCGTEYSQKGYRKPKWYIHPNYYKCRCCGGKFKTMPIS